MKNKYNLNFFFQLVSNDLKKEYIGSYFGLIWAFVQPISTIFVLWFVFEQGFRVAAVSNVPFVLWLSLGLIPWFFISDSIMSSANSIITQSYIVKKVNFPIVLLPLVKIATNFIIHLFLMFVFLIMYLLYGYSLDIYMFEIIYYFICLTVLLISFSLFFSSIIVFINDIKNFLVVLLQFFFWFTPIFWNIKTINPKYKLIFKLNPFEYIIQGYRDTFVNKIWFFDRTYETLYFWIIILIFLVSSYIIFNKLKSHFVDVL